MSRTEIDSLVLRVLGGDIDAYEGIVREYQQEVWKIAAAMLLNASKTEDIVQQTFINAFQHLDSFDLGRDFGAWLKEIARNQVRQEIRRAARENQRLELYHAHLLQMFSEATLSTQEAALEEGLTRCTERLPASSAKLVELRYQSALTFGEIAGLLGRTVEATRQQLARIRMLLRDCIEKHLAKV